MGLLSWIEDNEQRFLESTNQIKIPEEVSIERLIQLTDELPNSLPLKLNKWKEELYELATDPNLEPYREILRLKENIKKLELLINRLLGH